MRSKCNGFTLLEMMIVLSIIAILALMAVPSFDSKYIRAQIIESVDLIKPYKDSISAFYFVSKSFPKNNKEAGMPKPEFLLGNYVQKIELVNGAFQITLGNKAHPEINNKTLSVRPIVVKGSPESPISWVCGNSRVPDGMEAIGQNLTDIKDKYLPINCF